MSLARYSLILSYDAAETRMFRTGRGQQLRFRQEAPGINETLRSTGWARLEWDVC